MNENRKLVRVDLKFNDVNWERATVKQYELLKDRTVWRAFINGYSKKGFVIVEEEAEQTVMERLKELKPEVAGRKELTVEKLIESSYSWKNQIG